MTDLRGGIIEAANSLGVSPVDLATAISYETAGTFDAQKKGPTTQWGQHKGLIQFGEPQAKEYGVDWNDPVNSQLGKDGAVVKYLKKAGVKEGMGLLDIYSAINAGSVGLYDRTDANNGGAKGTVRDKVEQQMAQHAQKANKLIGDYDNYMNDDDFLSQVFSDSPQDDRASPQGNQGQQSNDDDDFLKQVFQTEDTYDSQAIPANMQQDDLGTVRSIDPRTGAITEKENEVVVDKDGNIRELGTKKTAGLGSQFLSGLPVDLKDRIAVFANARGLPVDRYGLTKDNEIYYIDENGQAQREEGDSLIDTIAGSSGDLITTAGEALGAFGGSFLGGSGTVAGATAGAAAGDIARQKLAQVAGVTSDYSPLQTASEAAFALVPGVGEAAIAKYGNRKAIRELDNINLTDAENLQKQARDQGISLTPAEATDSRSLKRRQQVLSQMPGSEEVMDDFYKERNLNQIPQAIDKNISGIGDSYNGFNNFSNAIDEVLEGNIVASQAKMRPLYENVNRIAEENNVIIDITDLTNSIKSELVNLPPKSKTSKQYKSLMALIDTSGKVKSQGFTANIPQKEKGLFGESFTQGKDFKGTSKTIEVSFKQANELKKAIDEFIDYRGIAQDKVTPRLKSVAMNVKNSLKDRMINEVPEYANTLFEAQKIIKSLERSNNPLSNFITKDDVLYGDDYIERGFHKMLNKGTPQEIAKLRKQFSGKGKDQAFNDGLASYLENQFIKISDTADETVGSGIKFVNKIAKTPKQRMNLKAAMGAEQYEGFDRFLNILEKTGKVKRTGAQTAPFGEAKEEIGRSLGASVIDYIKNIDITKPATLIPMGETAKRWAMESNKEYYRQLAKYMTSDRGLKSLKELSQISPLSRKARKAVAYIGAELTQSTQRNIKDRIDEDARQSQFKKEQSRNVLTGNRM